MAAVQRLGTGLEHNRSLEETVHNQQPLAWICSELPEQSDLAHEGWMFKMNYSTQGMNRMIYRFTRHSHPRSTKSKFPNSGHYTNPQKGSEYVS